MDKRELSIEEIRYIAFRTTGQSRNSEAMTHVYGKLRSSQFGRAIPVMRKPPIDQIQHLGDNFYAPTNLLHVPSSKWGLDQESVAINADQNFNGTILKKNRGLYVPKQHHGCVHRWSGLH